MSIAMIGLAPARLAPWITLIPTPPQPSTMTDSPGDPSRVHRRADAGKHAATDDGRDLEGHVVGIFTSA